MIYSLALCGVYHWLWVSAIPSLRGYRIRQETLDFEDGAQSQHLVKVPLAELEAWDASHDHSGRKLTTSVQVTDTGKEHVRGSGEDTDSNGGRTK